MGIFEVVEVWDVKRDLAARCYPMAIDNVVVISGTSLVVACSDSIRGKDGFEEGFSKMERSENHLCVVM